MADEEGRIDVDAHQVWYRRVGALDGTSGNVPLLLLHGGPGAGHDYLEPLAGLADDRAVIFYDQLGCGRSDQPDDPSLWHIDRFVREIDTVRAALGLERVHILGQSWGGWLAIYNTINGPTEFTVIGNLKDWDRIDRLGEITAPTLITVGRHDEITPACAETIHQGIAGSRLTVFENSAHCAHLEETGAYLATVAAFLAEVEDGRG
jgi:pimeloyl-ACP methyl ester carboxylesterase